jgi:hypothetical protein
MTAGCAKHCRACPAPIPEVRAQLLEKRNKVEIEEDEAPAMHADTARKALTEALGQDGRDRVLATLYIVRQDCQEVR